MRTIIALLLFSMFNQSGFAQIAPQKTADDQYSLQFNGISFSVDPSYGGRISSLSLNGTEMLETFHELKNDNWGGTFWTSPQSVWNWPPPDVLNQLPYKVTLQKDKFTISSAENTGIPNCIFEKEFSAGVADTSIRIVYTIRNPKQLPQSFAPWQIVRVPAGGLCFFPSGNGKINGDLAKLTMQKKDITWFKYQDDQIPGGIPKLFSDGKEGWMAFVNDRGLLLIFKFKDIALKDAAPGEAEIELYTNPNKVYTELETQGAYQSIPANSFISWEMKWYVRKLPKGIDYKKGNDALVEYVRNVAK